MLPIISQIYAGTADSEVVRVTLSPAEGDTQQVTSKDISSFVPQLIKEKISLECV